MKKTTANKLSKWLLMAPLKFAFLNCAITTAIFLIIGLFSPNQDIAYHLMTTGFITSSIVSATLIFKGIGKDNLSQQDFISIHNFQTIISTAVFIISSFLITGYITRFLMHSQTSAIITIVLLLAIALYQLGLALCNIYAKFRRIRAFNVPTWKIIFSMPFGFSSLWTAGYLIDTKDKDTINTPSITKCILAKKSNIILSFIFITTVSGFFFGLYYILLTFIYAIGIGLWTLYRGKKDLVQNMPTRFSTIAIIANISIIIILSLTATLAPKAMPDAQITISDTEFITE